MPISADTVADKSRKLLYFNDGGSTVGRVNKSIPAFGGKGVEFYYPCVVVDSNGIGFKPAGSSNMLAKYIQNQDNKTTFACADDVKILASGNFSGCIFQLWRDDAGKLWGAHVYKGKEGEKVVSADVDQAARGQGWKLLYSIDTKGKADFARKKGQIFVVVVVGDSNADIIVQHCGQNGGREKLVDWHTVYDYASERLTITR